ncbi:hypothetical protein G7054_g9819 [Neopestalotiopsis clavispora]|nr:hypothetical protein G7054_g9819 [Neopestalotiopsis clavispora]
MSETNISEASSAFSRFHLPPSHPQLISKIPKILPHERVFPIQIGSELFKLSGASLSSDAPSYFSQYFLCQIKTAEENGEEVCSAIRTLYIDRDPETFKDISLHLQGYHVAPRDGTHFVRLFADAQFYTLPKLMSQLYEESIFMSIGHREFQIPRDLFQGPGNSPNFFSLGYAIFFSTPEEIFPGLKREGLIRPPSIQPPAVTNRSADIFADLVNLLKGYPVHVRDEEHRASLLRDCRYFNFKGLEQRLIPHHISFNQSRHRSEIVLRIEDILKSGISFAPDPVSTPMHHSGGGDASAAAAAVSGWINYARPFVDDAPHELILEIGGENTRIHTHMMRADFYGQVKARIAKLFEVIAAKLNLPPTTQLPAARAGASFLTAMSSGWLKGLALGRQHGALLGAQQRRVVLEPAHERGDLRRHLPHRPARLPHLERDQVGEAGRQERRRTLQHVGADVPRRLGPCSGLEDLMGQLDGLIHVLGAGGMASVIVVFSHHVSFTREAGKPSILSYCANISPVAGSSTGIL